jgi:hypothetical protein
MKLQIAERKLLIITSPNDWHWAIGLEFYWQEFQSGKEISILDASYVGEIGTKSIAKFIFDKRSLRVKALKFLKSEGISVYRSKFPSPFFWNRKKFSNQVLSTKEFLEQADCPEIFNSVVEISGNLRPTKTSARVVDKEYHKYHRLAEHLSQIDTSRVQEIITVNGRFTKNATVKTWCQKKNIKVSFIEFGATKTKYEHFQVGPHSMLETEEKIEKLWANAPSDRADVAESFLKREIKNRDPVGIDWRSRMNEGKLPEFQNKKICTFFASTEAEYAGVGDIVPEGFFSNQKDAFDGLVNVLDPEVWQVFLRRHPAQPGRRSVDAESHLWENFSHLKNVKIIPPDSDIDSFALGLKSDLVANFCSTLAMDFIAAGKQEVLTLGTAPWNSRIKSRFTPTEKAITKFLKENAAPCSREDTYPWAYFCSSFGTDFQLLGFLEKGSKWDFVTQKALGTPLQS